MKRLGDEEVKAVVEVLKREPLCLSGYYKNPNGGPSNQAFEEALAAYHGLRYAVTCSNGTSALHIALLACGVKRGDEVIVPPLTFYATASAVLMVGAKPVFADVDPKTYNIDPDSVNERLTPKTKAIIPVHLLGMPVDVDRLIEVLPKNREVIIIEDNAQACIPPNSTVILRDRIATIQEVSVGDQVLSHDGKFHKVVRVFRRPYRGKIVEVTPWCFNLPLQLTPEHPVRAIKAYKTASGWTIRSSWKDFKLYGNAVRHYAKGASWIPAGMLRKGDFIVWPIPKLGKTQKTITFANTARAWNAKRFPESLEITPELLTVAGYYISEGCSSKDGLRFANTLSENIDRYCESLYEVFGLEPTIKEQKDGTIGVFTYSKALRDNFSRWFGRYAWNKRIPEWILNLDTSALKHFLKALWAGDGTKTKDSEGNYYYSYKTTSKTLAIQLVLLLLRHGIVPSIAVNKPDKPNWHYSYEVRVTADEYFEKLANLLDQPFEKRKEEDSRGPASIVMENSVWLPIREVRIRPYSGFVYNLEVEGSNSYVANLIPVHNCGAKYKGQLTGTFGKASILSFQETKTITTGEGGAVLTDDKKVAEKARFLRNHGAQYGLQPYLTYNYRMTEIQAAIGLVQLRKLDSFIKMQVENAKELFKVLPKEVHPPFIPNYAEPTLYIVGCTVEEGFPREKFVEALTRKGVNRLLPGATVSLGYTKTIMELPLLKKFKKPCPVAEDLVKKFLWFDITRWKTKDELQKDLDIIKEVLATID